MKTYQKTLLALIASTTAVYAKDLITVQNASNKLVGVGLVRTKTDNGIKRGFSGDTALGTLRLPFAKTIKPQNAFNANYALKNTISADSPFTISNTEFQGKRFAVLTPGSSAQFKNLPYQFNTDRDIVYGDPGAVFAFLFIGSPTPSRSITLMGSYYQPNISGIYMPATLGLNFVNVGSSKEFVTIGHNGTTFEARGV